jgi:aspartate ammonia-lyase
LHFGAGGLKVSSKKLETRLERDHLGEIEVPMAAYWGPRTARWLGGRRLDPAFKSRESFHPYLIEGLSTLYKARLRLDRELSASGANGKAGNIDEPTFNRIKAQVCDEILSGQWRNEFVVTPTSSADGVALLENLEEVVERRALEIIGNLPAAGMTPAFDPGAKSGGMRELVLKEDSFMAGTKLALLTAGREMASALLDLERLLRRKSLEFEKLLRSRGFEAESELALAREFNSFGNAAGRHLQRLHVVEERLLELSLKTPTKEGRARLLQEIQALTGFKVKAGEEAGLGNYTQAAAADVLSASSFVRDLAAELSRLVLGLSTLRAVQSKVPVLTTLHLTTLSVLALDQAVVNALREPILVKGPNGQSTPIRNFAQALAAQAVLEAVCNLSQAIKYFNQDFLLTATLAE